MPDSSLPRLVVLTGPIASGKNATAEVLVQRTTVRGLRVVLADLDDVAWMVVRQERRLPACGSQLTKRTER